MEQPQRFVDEKGRGGTLRPLKNGRTALRYDDGRIVEVQLAAHEPKGQTMHPPDNLSTHHQERSQQ